MGLQRKDTYLAAKTSELAESWQRSAALTRIVSDGTPRGAPDLGRPGAERRGERPDPLCPRPVEAPPVPSGGRARSYTV